MRQQLTLNKCVGITKSGELIMVDYLFVHDENFHGATGTRFSPLTQSDIDDRNDIDNVTDAYGYLWEEAVKDGLTKLGQEEYMQQFIDSEVNYGDGLFFGHDTSSVHLIPDDIKATHYQGYESFECVGGGRMFPLREEMLIIFDQDLWDAVNAIEQFPQDLEAFREVIGGDLTLKAVSRE